MYCNMSASVVLYELADSSFPSRQTVDLTEDVNSFLTQSIVVRYIYYTIVTQLTVDVLNFLVNKIQGKDSAKLYNNVKHCTTITDQWSVGKQCIHVHRSINYSLQRQNSPMVSGDCEYLSGMGWEHTHTHTHTLSDIQLTDYMGIQPHNRTSSVQ